MDNPEIKMQLKSLVSNFKRANIFFSRTQKFHDRSNNVQLWKHRLVTNLAQKFVKK